MTGDVPMDPVLERARFSACSLPGDRAGARRPVESSTIGSSTSRSSARPRGEVLPSSSPSSTKRSAPGSRTSSPASRACSTRTTSPPRPRSWTRLVGGAAGLGGRLGDRARAGDPRRRRRAARPRAGAARGRSSGAGVCARERVKPEPRPRPKGNLRCHFYARAPDSSAAPRRGRRHRHRRQRGGRQDAKCRPGPGGIRGAPPPQAAPAPAEPDYTAELEKLAKLRDEGVITAEDFEAKKQQVLGI